MPDVLKEVEKEYITLLSLGLPELGARGRRAREGWDP